MAKLYQMDTSKLSELNLIRFDNYTRHIVPKSENRMAVTRDNRASQHKIALSEIFRKIEIERRKDAEFRRIVGF